jgi:Xaa-Pro aminopeptidase
MIKERLVKLRKVLNTNNIDGILISQPENRYYLSGFSGSDGYLLITNQESIIVVDFRYIEQVKKQSPDFTIFEIKGKMSDWFPKLLEGQGISKLGFESTAISFAQYKELSEILADFKPQIELIPFQKMAENVRTIKEPDEIEKIRKASEISDGAFEYVTDRLKVGTTEKQLAWDLEKHMREHGSQTLPFEIIIGAGPNGALPHAHPSDRPIAAGEPVVIDMGAKFEGYASDLTRTICIGKPDDTFKKIYDIVLRAQETAINGIREGMSALEVDSLARNVIKNAGYADKFGHGLGHGVGLAVHDTAPRLNTITDDVLVNGMVFSIEPGIYLPEWGGVRIEDTVTLENGKVKLLSHAKKMAV